MATMTIRNIQDILRTALSAEPVQTVSLVEVIRSRVEHSRYSLFCNLFLRNYAFSMLKNLLPSKGCLLRKIP